MIFIAYAVGIVIFAAGASQPIYLVISGFGGEVAFEKVVFRSMELGALVGLWPLLRFLRLRGAAVWGFGAYGRGFRDAAHRLGISFAIGVSMIALPAVVLVLLGVRVPADAFDAEYLLKLTLLATLAGLIVALVEEIWLRGALFSAVAAKRGHAGAVVATSTLYALVHFIRPDVAVPAAEVGVEAAVRVIAGSFGRFVEFGYWDSALALAAAGWLLAELRLNTRWIVECIGLHAGWVLAIRLVKKTTVLAPDAPAAFLVGRYDGIIGLLIAGIFAGCAWWLRARRAEPGAS